MVSNEKASKIKKLFVLQPTLFSLKFVGTVFFEVLFVGKVFVSSIILPHTITELSIILPIYILDIYIWPINHF